MRDPDHLAPAQALALAYAWADSDDDRLMAVAITLVDLRQAQVLDALQPRRELPRPLTFGEAINATLGIDDFAWGTGLAQLDGIGRWTVVIEPNGWRCSVPDELAAMFANATAMNVFWNVNSVMSCCLVREGVVVRAFDGLLPSLRRNHSLKSGASTGACPLRARACWGSWNA